MRSMSKMGLLRSDMQRCNSCFSINIYKAEKGNTHDLLSNPIKIKLWRWRRLGMHSATTRVCNGSAGRVDTAFNNLHPVFHLHYPSLDLSRWMNISIVLSTIALTSSAAATRPVPLQGEDPSTTRFIRSTGTGK